MGMFDSFYFEKGFLPDDKTQEGEEFQTKDLDCDLDDYLVDKNGNVRKFVWDGKDGKKEDTTPINCKASVYSHEFVYDNPKDILNRKYLGTKYQNYEIEIVDSKIVSAKKIAEYGYDKTERGG